jgi:hypothetical protein
VLGLLYLRVPTWCPFRLQFYCNGHGWLARKLRRAGIGFTLVDNAFVKVSDLESAQQLADRLSPNELHRRLDHYAKLCCPVLEEFTQRYHWSLMQVEYATDLLFRSEAMLGPLYEQLSRQAVLAVKAEQVATFLGKKITPQLAQEIGNRFTTRIEGTCIKHRLGKAGVKMYDKFGRVLRLETTANDVSFFKHHRKVEHKDGHTTREVAPLKKTIYSLLDLREILRWGAGLGTVERAQARWRAYGEGTELLPPYRAGVAARVAAARIQHPGHATRRRQTVRAPTEPGHPVASTPSTACARIDQTHRPHLPLLPHAIGTRGDRSRLFPDPVPHHPGVGTCALTDSSPFRSTLG